MSATRSAQPVTQSDAFRNSQTRSKRYIVVEPRELVGVKRTTDQKVGGSNPSGRATVFAFDKELFRIS